LALKNLFFKLISRLTNLAASIFKYLFESLIQPGIALADDACVY
jgi:hypothetical protein